MKPEIIVGIVGGIGTNIDSLISELKLNFKSFEYEVEHIKISDLFIKATQINCKINKNGKPTKIKAPEVASLKKKITLKKKKIEDEKMYINKMNYKIDLGNLIREKTNDNSILAYMAIYEIFSKRILKPSKQNKNNGKIYLIDQLKTIDEYKVFRKVYGRSFILIGAYEDKEKRRNNLEIKSKISLSNQNDRDTIQEIIDRDADENLKYGQNVENLFPEAHLFVDVGNIDDLKIQIKRFVNIIFDYPYHTPTRDEIMMFLAKGLASRSADLGRQVGAVISNDEGDIISIGCNDVPKLGGGQYWENDIPDLRDFRTGHDANMKLMLNDIHQSFNEIFEYCECKKSISKVQSKFDNEFENASNAKEFKRKFDTKIKRKKIDELEKLLRHTLIAKHLEFGRCIHAEEAAICDAARRGVSLKNTTLYCTTFPCHLCAKYILAVGIKKVIYIDPYPKSRAKELFNFSIAVSESEVSSGKLLFEPFKGIAPRRFFHSFLKRKDNYRKDEDGNLPSWPNEENLTPTCFLKCRTALSYIVREFVYIKKMKSLIKIKNSKMDKNIKELKVDLENILKKYTDWNDETIVE